MTALNFEILHARIGEIEVAEAGATLAELATITVDTAVGGIDINIALRFPGAGLAHRIEAAAVAAAGAFGGGEPVSCKVHWKIATTGGANRTDNLRGVKNIVAVASGKGGVGKSTTAVNLALALCVEGARVGLLDADIYGPSQQIMLGIPEGCRPAQKDGKYLLPVVAHGLQTMSMGYLVTEKTPMVWRGPMASGALQQMLNQTLWDDIDYLIVDMPPGTGDIQLTLSQQVPVSGAVIVTTPQDIALLDAIKGIEMFAKVGIPVLGAVENMSYHVCRNCGHTEALFGEGGGERLARAYDAPVLGRLPLTMSIREQVDSGRPTVVADPDCAEAAIYRSIARGMAARLALRASGEEQLYPAIEITDD